MNPQLSACLERVCAEDAAGLLVECPEEPARQKRWVLPPCPTPRRISNLAQPELLGKTGAVLAGLWPAHFAAKRTLYAAVRGLLPSV